MPTGYPYCAPADLVTYGLPAAALSKTTAAQQTAACMSASRKADSYLRGRYALPLASFGEDIVMHTAWVASYMLMMVAGFSSRPGSDEGVRARYYEAVGDPSRPGSGWFPGIEHQHIHPDVTPAVPQPGDAVHDLPQVTTSQRRGWQQYGRNGKPVV